MKSTLLIAAAAVATTTWFAWAGTQVAAAPPAKAHTVMDASDMGADSVAAGEKAASRRYGKGPTQGGGRGGRGCGCG